MDSKDPYIAGDEYIAWLQAKGKDPAEKLLIASDTLDVDQILGLQAYFGGSLASGVNPSDFFSAADFHDRNKWTPQRRIRFGRECGGGRNNGVDRIPVFHTGHLLLRGDTMHACVGRTL